ncbi:flagellar hook assembly protein FlgD [Rhodoferax sp. BAB1]|uniref:flagellar hook assembly protein FlgD n=1 Tax=Rhodoferax sp. BAB1 TaxID=2741720 RepID=UPI00157693A5|nr:flagellar hook assembly protein FlgD [Rhodoferax sp. BAB1]QKO23697.1 flagellar hook assembly protein FlgD [Rhodoferax sp. BAB1]
MAVDSATYINSLTNTGSSSNRTLSTDPAQMQDRFLKLLVAQINSQDPLNPMDNAQMTTQMAQINTVSGIQQLNSTMQSMTAQFSTMQVLQGAALVGRDVFIESDQLVVQDGVARGAIELSGATDNVKIEILNGSGQIIDTLSAGSLPAGRHEFAWDASAYAGTTEPSFRIVATRAGNAIETTGLARSTVESVGSEDGVMQIRLFGRDPVSYADIKSIL